MDGAVEGGGEVKSPVSRLGRSVLGGVLNKEQYLNFARMLKQEPELLAKVETLERENAALCEQLARICKEGFGNQDTIGLEPADGYVLRQLVAMREAIREAFNSFAEAPESDEAWLLTERQRTALSKLQPFLKP